MMSLPETFFDNPASIVGGAFKFTSGNIVFPGYGGYVLRVGAAPNAAGKLRHVVIHTLEDGKTYRTHWSYFRVHAELLEA